MRTFFRISFFSVFLLLAAGASAQTNTATPAAAADEEFPKKKAETKFSEVIQIVADSLTGTELLKRAVNWVKIENPKYVKASGATTGSKAECTVSFFVKPKELNPETDYTGKITMKVSIECKDNRYKYTVSQIKHVSKSGNATGGSIDNVVPECGSMNLGDLTWRKLKGEALKDANMVVTDLRAGMDKPSEQAATEEW